MKKITYLTETVDLDLEEGKSAAYTRSERVEEFQINPLQLLALTVFLCFSLSFAIARLIQVNHYETQRQQLNS